MCAAAAVIVDFAAEVAAAVTAAAVIAEGSAGVQLLQLL